MRKKTSPRPLTGKIGITVHPKRNPSQVIGSDFFQADDGIRSRIWRSP
jgi:hypothetical protein